MRSELEALRANMARILRVTGERGHCRRCDAEVRFLRHVASGTRVPYDADGTPHAAACGERARKPAVAEQASLL